MRAGSTSSPASSSRTPAAAPPAPCERPGERVPLGVPRPGRPLVLVRLGSDERAGVATGPGRAGERPHRDGGVALVRHRRGAAARALARPRRPRSGRAGRRRPRSSRTPRRRRRAPRRARSARCGRCATAAAARRRSSSRGVRGARPRGRCSPSTASVPTAPPSCAAQAPSRHVRRPARGPRAGPRANPRPSAPNVVGTACCSSVRPAIGVARCARASARAGSTRPRRATSAIGASARPATSIAARVDDVLAGRAPVHEPGRPRGRPGLAQRPHERLDRVARRAPVAAELRRCRRGRRGSGSAIAPGQRAPGRRRRSPRRSRAPARRRASPRARPGRRPRPRSRPARRGVRTSSQREERRLALALEVDVEAQLAVAALGADQRRRARRR